MKKFYKLVTTHFDAPTALWHIHLDGRPVKCPSGAHLATHSETLAQDIALEWSAQESEIIPGTMPLTQILTTKIDRVGKERAAMEAALFKYFDTDLICYRAGNTPQEIELKKQQEEIWNPWLDWFEERFGQRLEVTSDLAALSHCTQAHEQVRAYVQALDDDHFTAFQLVTAGVGSIILGLAFMEGKAAPQELFDCAHIEERFKGRIYNEDKYGLSPHEEKKAAALMRDLEAAEKYVKRLT